jgi:F0F1-type ATP synthase assembly protein I
VNAQRMTTMTMTMSQRTKTTRQQSLRGGGRLLSCLACLLLVSSISTATAFTSPTITRSTSISRMQHNHNHNTNRANAANNNKFHRASRCYGRRNDYYDDDEDDDYYDDDEDDDNDKRRRRKNNNKDDLSQGQKQSSGLNLPSSFGRRDGWRLPDSVTKSLLAGVFILGVGLGVTVDSQVNTNPKDLASRDAIDQAAPNKNLCAQYGASAMAFDQRVFVSFNPFNVYVSQADVKPACVLREANVVPTLKSRGLINDDEVRSWYVDNMYWMHHAMRCVCAIVCFCMSKFGFCAPTVAYARKAYSTV